MSGTRPMVTGPVELGERSLALTLDGRTSHFHYVWLRDNSWSGDSRVIQSGERQLFTAAISEDIAPVSAWFDPVEGLRIEWNDGHHATYATHWLKHHDYSEEARAGRRHAPKLWDAGIGELPSFVYEDVVGADEKGQLAYLDALRDYGAAIVHGVPSVDGEVERFAEAFGHVREVAFARIHDVRHDPKGYNVAHTPGELKPHTDLPSYTWPPSIQLLHFLVNQATGGESTLVDGWKVLADLRAEDPEAFRVLTQVAVPYQLFSDTEDTRAVAPMIQLDTEGTVRTFRFSNQLALPLDIPFGQVEPFYAAYRKLGRMIDSDRYKLAFKAEDGDLLTVHGHRVLHGRLSYDPASGARHLQDVYMEWDDLMARRRVLRGEHKPLSAAVPALEVSA
ncbi:TauD/TfdA family dioxygenase [Streptomyces sp. NPDC002588]|uniref:clavaminate synthase family protein n=1 Tax=Streptomyces sp. NPDC002588 TaxID=3154419 RepID=UPI003324E48A